MIGALGGLRGLELERAAESVRWRAPFTPSSRRGADAVVPLPVEPEPVSSVCPVAFRRDVASEDPGPLTLRSPRFSP